MTHPNFNAVDYELGSSGSFTIRLTFHEGAADVSFLGVHLFFLKEDGTLHEGGFFGENYDPSLYVPADTEVTFSWNIQIPRRGDIVSGPFYFLTEVYHREHETVWYGHHKYGPFPAGFDGNLCYLNNPSYPSYSSLKSDYNELQGDYSSLQGVYSSLQDDYDDLDQSYSIVKTSNNIIIVIVAVLIVSIVYFAKRRPRKVATSISVV